MSGGGLLKKPMEEFLKKNRKVLREILAGIDSGIREGFS